MTQIFISIPWFDPAFKAGGPVQSIMNLVNGYTNDVNYWIFTSNTDLNGTLLDVETNKWQNYNRHTRVWYASENVSNTLVKQVEEIKPDILYIIGLYSWRYNIVPMWFCKAPVKIISVRGMLHKGALSQKYFKKKLFLQFLKLLRVPQKSVFHATDKLEENYIRKVFGKKVRIFSAGNFPRKFVPAGPEKIPGTVSIITVALISPMKNHLLILQALQTIGKNIDYHICGPVKDNDYWNRCQEEIQKMGSNIHIHIHGEIQPDKVQENLHNAHVFILPSKSENFGHAIYEALSAGKPVITSNSTPWNQLDTTFAGMNIDPDIPSLKRAIEYFADMDQIVYSNWSMGAMLYAEDHLDVEKIKGEYSTMFNLAKEK